MYPSRVIEYSNSSDKNADSQHENQEEYGQGGQHKANQADYYADGTAEIMNNFVVGDALSRCNFINIDRAIDYQIESQEVD